MEARPSVLPAATYLPDGSNRANEAPENNDVCTAVGWVMWNGLINEPFMLVGVFNKYWRHKGTPETGDSGMTLAKLDLNPLLDALKVPSDFARYGRITEGDLIARLESWKEETYKALGELRDIVLQNELTLLREQAQVVSAAGFFDGDGPWVTPRSLEVSREILATFSQPRFPLLESILTHHVKPLFRSNPHPSINLSTGRKLPRPAGGPMASQDYYEGQAWKGYPGAECLVSWCIRQVQGADYEKLWHLIIPPVMAFLDDYEAPYKLLGVGMVSDMLKTVPKELLRRTGVDGLLLSSLTTCLHHLQNPETPALIRATIPTILTLVQLTTPPESGRRFDQLSALLGDGIVGSVWTYSSNDVETLLASVDVLPAVLKALGIGSARFLKALVVQLVHPLVLSKPVPIRLQISSSRALATVIDECAPRMCWWRGTILEGVGKCWVSTAENDGDCLELRRELRRVCDKLRNACPSVIEDFDKMLALDTDMFQLLLQSQYEEQLSS